MTDSTLPEHSGNPSTTSNETAGWQTLLKGFPWFEGEGRYPIPAYSEFMPPPRLGRSPYDGLDTSVYDESDPYGWQISELEQEYELKPGMEKIAQKIMEHLIRLGKGQTENHVAGHKSQNLIDNPYWSPELAARAGSLPAERYVILLPLALSCTQDDLGRVRWTLFGCSEQGPERAFWKGFYTSPHQEIPAERSLGFICRLLSDAYGEKIADSQQLKMAGFGILPAGQEDDHRSFRKEDLPSWTSPFIESDQADFNSVRYLLTFRPFNSLPDIVKESYFAGSLALLPFPGSLVFWGMQPYLKLKEKLPFALQIPLLQLFRRQGGPAGIRVPQSGWIKEPRQDDKPSDVPTELLVSDYHRTPRWMRIHRYENELEIINPRLVKVAKTLFSNDLEIMGLYDKPMARNCQLWTHDFELLLDGMRASRNDFELAEQTLAEGGLFGYRYFFPPMQVGKHEIYLHYLLAAYSSPGTGEARIIPDAPNGYLTAYPQRSTNLDQPTELWLRLLRRPLYLSAIRNFETIHDHYPHQTALNIITLLESYQLRGRHLLQRSFARALLRIAKDETFNHWLSDLPVHANRPEAGFDMQRQIHQILEPADKPQTLPPDLTFNYTSNRVFETAYWNDILTLSHGNYHTKDNADPIEDLSALSQLTHQHRDLEQLADYLIARHRDAIDKAGMGGKAVCGEMPFRWQTDFDFPNFGGWIKNQPDHAYERNILVIIPGRDRSQAVVLADHYDTAYMEDRYESYRGGTGVRLAADGADDNHSATAALLQAAPIYLNLAREGRLERDIWLLHLTGEEFPSDCLGARHFAQALVEKTLNIRLEDKQVVDLSGVRVVGVFVMDMIAHNRDTDHDVFQISPGKGAQSLELAWQAHLANCIWNAGTKVWNDLPGRRGKGRGKRSRDGVRIPEIADTLPLDGEVRTPFDPQSSLFNTDGQIFSDTGVPVVLFMENYDINRTGYHDSKDTLENIDLDYGAALAAIAIETTARVATQP